MIIEQLIAKYKKLGFDYRNSKNLAAEEILLSKIASSPLSEHVTLKGGVVMFNLTKNSRRVTRDVDFDLIRYSIDELSILLLIEKLNSINDGISISIDRKLEPLKQEDYQGVRAYIKFKDNKSVLRIKIDIGVHTYTFIEQEKIMFSFDTNNRLFLKVNPCEQIFIEKLISLSRFGLLSTRYKDIYDMYYLIASNLLDIKKTRQYLDLFLSSSIKKPHSISEIISAVTETLNNEQFILDASEPAYKWIDVDFYVIKNTILVYLDRL